MEKGFWTLVEEFVGQKQMPVTTTTAVLKAYLASRDATTYGSISTDFFEDVLQKDDGENRNLAWRVTAPVPGTLRFELR
ncbi:hypothetical protein ACOQFB_01120 [Anaeromyxobacter sp. Red801]|uniref:hypothetical protein n=1 Tax=Anaeromyxobacter sp. Red801 TaxID=3411632 RepID=UPI003BA16F5F